MRFEAVKIINIITCDESKNLFTTFMDKITTLPRTSSTNLINFLL